MRNNRLFSYKHLTNLGRAVGRVSALRSGGTRFDPGDREVLGLELVAPRLTRGFSG